MDIHNLIGSLLIAVADLLGDIPANDLPAVYFVEHNTLQEVCGSCTAAYTRPLILLSDKIDLENPAHMGILVHEVVHHHQEMRGRWVDTLHQCEQRRNREREAYAIQNIWYQSNNIPLAVHYIPQKCD